MNTININQFIFGRTDAEKKLQVINEMSAADIRKATQLTILRIVKECMDKESKKFYIKNDRRAGNDWNSTIEYLYVNNERPILMLYVQGGNTDTSTAVSYSDFNYGTVYHGTCRLGSFSYCASDIAAVVRCILAEYVYYKWIEKEAREAQAKIDALLHYKVVNPVLNHYYEKWDCWHRMEYNKDLRDRYYGGKQAIEDYANAHVAELSGKSTEKLQDIYKKVFVGEIK